MVAKEAEREICIAGGVGNVVGDGMRAIAAAPAGDGSAGGGCHVIRDDPLIASLPAVEILAAKKNDLVDGLVQMRLDQQLLGRVEKLFKDGATTEVALLSARRNVEADRLVKR